MRKIEFKRIQIYSSLKNLSHLQPRQVSDERDSQKTTNANWTTEFNQVIRKTQTTEKTYKADFSHKV
jgi:hypothetical protein